MIRDAICLLWEVDDTAKAMEVGLQATGETDYQPLPHKEQKMDRDCEGFYTRGGSAAPVSPSVPWQTMENIKICMQSLFCSCSIWLMMILIIDRKRMTLCFARRLISILLLH
jgi:hypothetical protein